jgi:succinoglycan biosynthesis protein ExoA
MTSRSGLTPRFDVVVPAFDEESHIGACLDAILAQDHSDFTVWVVDAGSTDRTADVVRAHAAADARVTLVPGGGRLNAGQAMNVGIARGDAELIARVDAHSRPAPDYLSWAAEIFAAHGPELACAGGQPEQVGTTRMGRAAALARRSRFGVGGSVYADTRAAAYVDTVQGGVYRRVALAAVGGFASDMLVGEDEEVNWRLRRAGYPIRLDTRLRLRHATRPTWRGLLRQYRNYGRSRARVLVAHPSFLRPRHMAPSALVAGIATLGVAGLHSETARRLLLAELGLYGLLAARCARIAAGRERELTPAVAACFAALHLGYGAGLLEGLVQVAGARLRRRPLQVAVTRR